MANYKVSYKMLAKQGEELKAAAKLIDDYAERVNQVKGKLGQDQMLAEVRNNLQKLNTQLGESRMVINTAGELLSKTVETYTGTETRQVKKVDNLKAHNRDFYKNPVTVASAGGTAAGAAGAVSSGQTSTTVNYTEHSIHVQSVAAASFSDTGAWDSAVVSASTEASLPGAAAGSVFTDHEMGSAAGVGALSGAVGGGTLLGAKYLVDENKKKKAKRQEDTASDGENPAYDPEAELALAIERVRRLEEEG
ncbi:MAG: hypothetical protein QM697_16670 [Lachnospiraceae bacterium]